MKHKLLLNRYVKQPLDVYTLIAYLLKGFTVKDYKRTMRKITNKI